MYIYQSIEIIIIIESLINSECTQYHLDRSVFKLSGSKRRRKCWSREPSRKKEKYTYNNDYGVTSIRTTIFFVTLMPIRGASHFCFMCITTVFV